MALHRPTLFNLMNSIVGVSVLSFPFCFHQCGVVLGPLAMITMAYFTKRTCSFLLISSQLGRRRSYESLAQYTYGKTGKFVVEACIIGLMAGTLCAFNVIIGDLAPHLFSNLFGFQFTLGNPPRAERSLRLDEQTINGEIKQRMQLTCRTIHIVQQTPTLRAAVMIFLAFSVGLPLSLMRDISSLSNISALSLGFYALFVLHVFLGSVPHLLEGTWTKHVNFWRPAGILQCLPIFSLAFACQTQLFGLYDSLPEPSVKKMENVVSVGIKVVSCVYLSVGVFGYLTFYDVGVKGDILTNYGSSSLAEILKLGFVMSVIVSFPLMVFPMRASINSLLFPSQTAGTENMPGGPGYMPQNRFVIITVVVICATLTVGIFIPQIEFVLGLTGATIGTLIVLVLPASMYLYAVQDTQGESRNLARISIVFGLICLVASSYSVLSANNHSHHESSDTLLPAIPVKAVNISKPVIGPIQAVKANNLKTDATLGDKQEKEAIPTLKSTENKEKKSIEGKRTIEDIRQKAGQRKEPAIPHPPDDKPADGPAEKNEKGADPVNEKRQLMSTDDANQSPDDSHDDKNLSSKLDAPQKAALRAISLNQDIEKKIQKLREKKAQVESDLKSLQNLKKPESRGKRGIADKPDKSAKDDGNEKGTHITPTDTKVPPSTTPSNITDIHIGPTSSSSYLESLPTLSGKQPAEVTIVANVPEKGVKVRDLKSNGKVGRTLKSKDTKDGRAWKASGYSNVWGKRLAKKLLLRGDRRSETGLS